MKFGKLVLGAAAVFAAAAGAQFALGNEPDAAADEAEEAPAAAPGSDEARNNAPGAPLPQHAHPDRTRREHAPAADRRPHGNAAPDTRPGFPDSELPPPPPPGAFSKEEAGLIKSVFTMSDAELRNLRTLIERLERVPAEQRRRLAADLERASQDMTAEQRENYMKNVRERFRKSQSNLLVRYFSSLSPKQADAERRKFLALDAAGRRRYLAQIREKMGYEPVPAEKRAAANARNSAAANGESSEKTAPESAPADAPAGTPQNAENAPAEAAGAPEDADSAENVPAENVPAETPDA